MLIARVMFIMSFLSLVGATTEIMAGPACTRIERKINEITVIG